MSNSKFKLEKHSFQHKFKKLVFDVEFDVKIVDLNEEIYGRKYHAELNEVKILLGDINVAQILSDEISMAIYSKIIKISKKYFK